MLLRALRDSLIELAWPAFAFAAFVVAIVVLVFIVGQDTQAGRICFSEPFETYRDCRDWARDALADGWTEEELTELVEEDAVGEWEL